MPSCLDLCLKSAVENRVRDGTEIIAIVDGYPDESAHVIEKYESEVGFLMLPQNKGMQYALNVGVMNASNSFVFIMNDDNVFGNEWDERIVAGISGTRNPDNAALTVNQVEPLPSIFNFVVNDLGRTPEDFQYDKWLEFENSIAVTSRIDEHRYMPDGRIFPFAISKQWYMAVGGFDAFYESPFWCDVDFFTKLEITNQIEFVRFRGAHLYHFGSSATKNRTDAEAELFKRSEGPAAQSFFYKWGFIPNLVENSRLRNNMKSPLDITLKGIRFK